jgi:hypothetical protein
VQDATDNRVICTTRPEHIRLLTSTQNLFTTHDKQVAWTTARPSIGDSSALATALFACVYLHIDKEVSALAKLLAWKIEGTLVLL